MNMERQPGLLGPMPTPMSMHFPLPPLHGPPPPLGPPPRNFNQNKAQPPPQVPPVNGQVLTMPKRQFRQLPKKDAAKAGGSNQKQNQNQNPGQEKENIPQGNSNPSS